MKRMILFATLMLLTVVAPRFALADEPVYPDYVQKAQALVEKASSQASELNSFTDEILIARNFIRNAEAEYKKHLSWTGKLDPKAEPTVKYFAAMAELQASVVLSRAGKIVQERERTKLESQVADQKAKIKVFDDKNAEIGRLQSELAAVQGQLRAATAEKTALSSDLAARTSTATSAEQKLSALGAELVLAKQALNVCDQKSKELDQARSEIVRLKNDLATLTAQKGAVESQSREQIEALNRQNDFLAEVGRLGGAIKPGSDNMTVMFVRSALFKTPKNDKLTAEGGKVAGSIADLLKKYPEFRVKLKVHGFGQPAKNEDAAATDRMARLFREALLDKGKFEPVVVEALGAGAAEPLYPKGNPEGNRRLEVTFVRK